MTLRPCSASGDAVARIYNLSLAGKMGSSTSPISSEVVWDSFWLYGLLLSAERYGEALAVPHGGNHTDRWAESLAARNQRMAGTGQPLWAHACDECEKLIYSDEEDQPRIPIGNP